MTIPMTVQDLIDELKKHDPVMQVTVIDEPTRTFARVIKIIETKNDEDVSFFSDPVIAILIDY